MSDDYNVARGEYNQAMRDADAYPTNENYPKRAAFFSKAVAELGQALHKMKLAEAVAQESLV